MKAWKISLFVISTIAILTIISLLYPADGIRIGNLTLKFPKPAEILVREAPKMEDPEAILRQWEIRQMDSLKNEFKDTIEFYQKAMALPTKFYFPNDDYTYFDNFFATVAGAKSQKRTARILHYGDSQIELDRITSNLRNFFQSKFGGGGPGLLPLYQSVATSTVNQSYSGIYTTYALYGDGMRNSGHEYGIMAKSFRISGNNTFYASSPKSKNNLRDQYSDIKLLFSTRNEGFTTTLQSKTLTEKSEKISFEQGIQMFQWNLDTPASSFSLHFSGNADIYGILVDHGYGVAVDNIAMRGVGGTIFTQMNDSLLAKCYKLLDIQMIILQFGGNAVPYLSNEKSIDKYVENIGKQIRYFQRIYPNIPILFIGPSDMSTRINGSMGTYKYLPIVIEKLKSTVLANGAAFWNIYEVMGGHNSMLAWVKKGWAGSDYVHFTPQGAQNIGNVLTNSFSTMYDFYQLRQHTSPIHFEQIWQDIKNQSTTTSTSDSALKIVVQ